MIISYLVSGAAVVAAGALVVSVVGAVVVSVVGATSVGVVVSTGVSVAVVSAVSAAFSLEPQEAVKRPIAKATMLNLTNFILLFF
jgi:hypothetical protein